MIQNAAESPMPEESPGYDEDLYAWALANARHLRNGALDKVDATNIAEELEDMGKSERRALGSHIRVLLTHLLKWAYQPGLRSPSWRLSIRNARDQIGRILEASPSLRRELPEVVEREYPRARAYAADETGLPLEGLPEGAPFGMEQMLDEAFLPG